MAAMILILTGAVIWLEVAAMRHVHRTALHAVQATPPAPERPTLEDLFAQTAGEITALLDLRACWFEPFPFDALLPRIEEGMILLPTAEPGVGPWSDSGVELAIRTNGLTLGRLVLVPNASTVGVCFPLTARHRAMAMAGQLGPPLAAALIAEDTSRINTLSAPIYQARSPSVRARGRSRT
jgi:hypothetical protein